MENVPDARKKFAMGWKILHFLVYWDLSPAAPPPHF